MKMLCSNTLRGVIALTCLLCYSSLTAQIDFNNCQHPVIGEPIPDLSFEAKHPATARISLSDFRGKWVFVDFWYSGCATCIKTLKSFNEIQARLKKQVQFIVIGMNAKQYGDTELLYSRLQKRQKLEHIAVFDSLLADKWCITAMPHVLVIDPDGILRAVTTGQDLTAESVRDVVNGKLVNFYPAKINSMADTSQRESTPNEIIFSSTVAKWNGERAQGAAINQFVRWTDDLKAKGYKVEGFTLKELFKIAFVGQSDWGLWNYLISKERGPDYWRSGVANLYTVLYPEVIVETSNDEMFSFDSNNPMKGGLYNFNLTIPPAQATSEIMMQTLQQNLAKAFGLTASIERRKMPYIRLVGNKNDLAKLKTHGGPFTITRGSTAAGFEARNISLDRFLAVVTYYVSAEMPLVINETGVDFNIDVQIDADLTDEKSLKKALRQLGMELQEAEKEMNVIVIRDEVHP